MLVVVTEESEGGREGRGSMEAKGTWRGAKARGATRGGCLSSLRTYLGGRLCHGMSHRTAQVSALAALLKGTAPSARVTCLVYPWVIPDKCPPKDSLTSYFYDIKRKRLNHRVMRIAGCMFRSSWLGSAEMRGTSYAN